MNKKQITGTISLAENLGGNFADLYADTIKELKRVATIGQAVASLNADQLDTLEILTGELGARTQSPDYAPTNQHRYAHYVEQWFASEDLGEITPESLATELNAQRDFMEGNA
jgi:hypothetical protein